MKKTIILFLFITPLFLTAQTNITELGRLNNHGYINDVWGYADSAGNEYALIGVEDGFSVVDVTDPANPDELFFLQGATSTWRDIKEWKGYAFVVHDGTQDQPMGLQVVNLNYLPDSVPNFTTDLGEGLAEAHNLFIDENGVLYIVGSNKVNGGAIFVDVDTDPESPTILGYYDLRYIHDLYVRGDTMWSAEINDGVFSVVDVSNKANPQVMAVNASPGDFAHNVWLSNDGNNLLTTDEIADGVIGSYDVSNLNNITFLDEIQSSPGDNVTPHNVFIKDDFAIISYYKDGVVVLDCSRPNNLIEVGNFDTNTLTGAGTSGCWGVYPYLPSGNVLATDMGTGLWVLGVNYQKGCYLEGTVTDINSTFAVGQPNVEIISNIAATKGDLQGQYQLGILDSGTYNVRFYAHGYISKTFNGVVLKNGQLTILDVQLTPATPFNFSGMVLDSVSGAGLANADVLIESQLYKHTTTTDINGNFTFNNIFAETYTMYAGKWGHITKAEQVVIASSSTQPEVKLIEGYYDDFLFDFNWSVTGNAAAGIWEKDIPVGTYYRTFPANADEDFDSDFGLDAYITGNGGGSAGFDDVDDGVTILTSPVFDLSTYDNPKLNLYYWFYNGGGIGSIPDDDLFIKLNNGTTTVTLDIKNISTFEWKGLTFNVKDYITPTADMQLILEIGDQDTSGHIVEAGLDYFFVTDSTDSTISVQLIENPIEIIVYPNPFLNTVLLNIPDNLIGQRAIFYNNMGKVVDVKYLNNKIEWGYGLPAGMYLMYLKDKKGKAITVRLIKTE